MTTYEIYANADWPEPMSDELHEGLQRILLVLLETWGGRDGRAAVVSLNSSATRGPE